MSIELLSGNEAIARGAFEHGVTVATGYPGTPSTEVLENLARYPEVAAQWSPNEKVALEVAIGASLAGARAIATMKHVGVNVAADPLMTLSYTGVNGGLVLFSADDPGIFSSQNEQDNRFYGRFARVPVLEPSDSQDCLDFAGTALEASEQLDTVCILRSTTRISHSKSVVHTGSRTEPVLRPYVRDPRKYVMVPGYAKLRQPDVLARFDRIVAWAEGTPINRIEWRDRSIGVITGGISYQYVREACPDASVLKLGVTYPVPPRLLKEFAAGVKRVVVVEELEPFLYEQVRLVGIDVKASGLPRMGELGPRMVRSALRKLGAPVPECDDVAPDPIAVPARPPVLCPGCPHRAVFYVLQKLHLTVTGDIGCYTLGALPPLSAMDAFMCMGASIGMSTGIQKADPERAKRTVAVIGDSTFLHSGMTGLMDMVYNGGTGTVLILDNGTTAMTGHQDHPATGRNAKGQEAPKADLEAVCRGLGVRRTRVLDPFDLKALEAAIREEMDAPEVSVIIARRMCALIQRPGNHPVTADNEVCRGCRLCAKLGCPAMSFEDGKPRIDQALCSGCGLCAGLCPFDALKLGGSDA